MKTMQVTLLGGPADLQRHVIDRGIRSYQVAVLDQRMAAAYDAPFAHYSPVVTLNTHTYEIRQVGENVFVGVWQERWR